MRSMFKSDRYNDVPLGVESAWPQRRIELRRGALLRLSAGDAVTAHAGSVWITEEDSRRDVLLHAGQTFRLARPGLALVEAAFSDASISLSS